MAVMRPFYLKRMDKSFITGYNIIRNNYVISPNQEKVRSEEDVDFPEFIKALYQRYKIDYPKFYKMDNLCKLAFISSEILLKETGLKQKYSDEAIGIVLCNSSASIDSDCKHVESFVDKANYYPSPSIFVYTLPNIAIGEICIRNSIKGENALFVFEKFEVEFSVNYLKNLLDTGKAEACIGGWIEYSEEGFESFLFSVERKDKLEPNQAIVPFSTEEIRKLYLKN